jgi:peroxiredoxin Q/BCP
MTILTVDDLAPQFTLEKAGRGTVTLADYSGHYVVVYFYPKDDTSGCTRQACEFTAALPEFEQLHVPVIGISRDSVQAHEKFIEKHQLKITLASDPDGAVCAAYNVWVEKNMYGRTYFGIERSTFLINPDGKIAALWRKVKVPQHVQAVLTQLYALNKDMSPR